MRFETQAVSPVWKPRPGVLGGYNGLLSFRLSGGAVLEAASKESAFFASITSFCSWFV